MIGGTAVFAVIILALIDRRKGKIKHINGKKRASHSLQEFFPVEGFDESGAMIVNGKFRRMIRVGNVNLYSKSMEEIEAIWGHFREMLKKLDEPFQISIQARRANYTDYVKYVKTVVEKAINEYQNPAFSAYGTALMDYLSEEAKKVRTDRENVIVVGVLSKIGGESDHDQIERLDREMEYVDSGLQQMGVEYEVLDEIGMVEAIQNVWSRERAVSQRYRDSYEQHVHAPQVRGAKLEVSDIEAVSQKSFTQAQ